MADVDSKISLKLLIDARSNKVIFAEAGKDFVDFMFSLLTLPLGAVIKLLSPSTMVGSIGDLYQSIENLNETYFVTSRDKSSLLQPNVPIFDAASPLRLNNERKEFPSASSSHYPFSFSEEGNGLDFSRLFTSASTFTPTFSSSSSLFSSSGPTFTPTFSSSSSLFSSSGPKFRGEKVRGFVKAGPTFTPTFTPTFSSSSSLFSSSGPKFRGEKVRGFVKGVITYMVTDDLEVTPMSAISSITLINRFNMKDSQLEEKVIVVGMKEGLALLKASLESRTVLTDVFCSSVKKTNAPSHLTEIGVQNLQL